MDQSTLELVKKVIKEAAEEEGKQEEELRTAIKKIIDEAQNSPYPEVRVKFEKLFGKKTPTAEKFIYEISQLKNIWDKLPPSLK